MFVLCEFELFKDEDMYVALPFGFPGATQGYDLQEASEMAYSLLKESGEFMLVLGQELPTPPLGNTPQHGGRILLVGAEISLDNVERVTASEAARILGVSRPRISQMLKNNKLAGWREGRDTYITMDSIRVRLEERPKAGRPKKEKPEVEQKKQAENPAKQEQPKPQKTPQKAEQQEDSLALA